MSELAINALVSAEDLAAHPEWRVFDCRHDLQNTAYGRQAYARGHIPGAQFLHLDDDLSGASGVVPPVTSAVSSGHSTALPGNGTSTAHTTTTRSGSGSATTSAKSTGSATTTPGTNDAAGPVAGVLAAMAAAVFAL